ncbi:MAG: hypothetical protein WC728_18915 [Elusimicrobiota bacterium]
MGTYLLVSALLSFGAETGRAAPAQTAASTATAHGYLSQTSTAKPTSPEDPLLKKLRKPLQAYLVDSSRENDGLYAAEDPDSEDTWMLELGSIGTGELRKRSKKEAVVRVEFVRRGDPESGEKDVPVLIDFTLVEENKRWTVTDEAIFSIDGAERFTYTADHQRQPRPPARPLEEEEGPGPAPATPKAP